jgi:hypothetical protein
MNDDVNQLHFDAQIATVLVPNYEGRPFVTVHLTSDIAMDQNACLTNRRKCVGVGSSSSSDGNLPLSSYVMSDSHQARLVSDLQHQWNVGAEMPPDNSNDEMIMMAVDLPISPQAKIEVDSALCFHIFCAAKSDHSAWGSHTCGWASISMVSLIQLANGPPTVGCWTARAKISDNGSAPAGARGNITVTFNTATAAVLRTYATPETSVTMPQMVEQMITKMRAVQYDAEQIYSQLRPTVATLDAPACPAYVSCGGCIVRPACAFLMTKTPPTMGADYYIRATVCTLTRYLWYRPDVQESQYLPAFVDCVKQTYGQPHQQPTTTTTTTTTPLFTPDELGHILVDVATWFSVNCLYLFDRVLSASEKALEYGEEYSRLAVVTLCADCEDFAYHILACLREIEQGSWTHPVCQALQTIRMQYVATLNLKAMPERASAIRAVDDASVPLALHECCDLIPIIVFRNMLQRHQPTASVGVRAVRQVLDERASLGYQIDETRNKALRVVVGDGTHYVRVPSTIFPHDIDATRQVKATLEACHFTHVNTVIVMDTTDPMAAYQYVTWAAVDEMYTIGCCTRPKNQPWAVPCVAIGQYPPTKELTPTYGGKHSDYISGRDTIVAIPMPSIRPEDVATIERLEKFEHPFVRVQQPHCDMPFYQAQAKLVTDWYNQLCARHSPVVTVANHTYMSIHVEVFVSLWNITLDMLQSLATRCAEHRMVITHLHPEHIVEGMATVNLVFGVN